MAEARQVERELRALLSRLKGRRSWQEELGEIPSRYQILDAIDLTTHPKPGGP